MCLRTISAISKCHGIKSPVPQRRKQESKWKRYLVGHASEIVATDFITAEAWAGWARVSETRAARTTADPERTTIRGMTSTHAGSITAASADSRVRTQAPAISSLAGWGAVENGQAGTSGMGHYRWSEFFPAVAMFNIPLLQPATEKVWGGERFFGRRV
jgi:hypothetical protein